MTSQTPQTCGITKKGLKFGASDREDQAMFYSQYLLSKNGALAAIWVAGCCLKRLKKRQVIDTHIPSSVDKILLEGLPSVTYRILAYLLLGVVRIYSRKVEYLFQDSHVTVCDINKFSVGKKVVPFRDLVRSSYTIVLPESYALDAFQLEVTRDGSGGDIAQNEENFTLQDAVKDTLTYSLNQNPFDEIFPHCQQNCEVPTSAGITLLQESCSFAWTPDKATVTLETSSSACTPPDKVLSPHQMNIDMEVSSPGHMKNLQTSKEKLRELRFSQEEVMDVDIFCGVDDELLNLINEYQVQNIDDQGGVDLEKVVLQNRDHVMLVDKEVSYPLEKTHHSEIPDPAGNTIQEVLVVSTPAKKEKIQRSSKRKCIIDETVMLDNEEMKQVISDASGLVCKRRKGPHTVIDIWRFYRIPALSKNFLEPLIPCAALELQHVRCKERTERTGQSSSAASNAVETMEHLKLPVAVSPRTQADSRSNIAPGTPIRAPTSARMFASPKAGYSDGEDPAHLYECVRRESSVNNEVHGPNLMEEMDENEGDSQDLHKNKNRWSTRTRMVASFLHQVMHIRKREGEESINLLPIFERKTRAESARFFFEILMLSSGGFVNVMQEKAYSEVLLQETAKMEATLMNC